MGMRECGVAHRNARGVTFIEVLVAAVIGSLLAGGTLLAFLLSAKLARDAVTMSEATDYATETVEKFRNQIACDDPWFNDSPDCNFQTVDGNLPQASTPDLLPPDVPTSALLSFNNSDDRRYRVQPADCDGVAGNDCYLVTVTLTWAPPT